MKEYFVLNTKCFECANFRDKRGRGNSLSVEALLYVLLRFTYYVAS
jgi:hypothetical protein